MLTHRDRNRLMGVHQDLITVVTVAAERFPLFVIEGLRTQARQIELFRKGASKTMNSRHLTGHAVDLGPLPLDWGNKGAFREMAEVVKAVAAEQGVLVSWGGDWQSFYDGPHFELARSAYP